MFRYEQAANQVMDVFIRVTNKSGVCFDKVRIAWNDNLAFIAIVPRGNRNNNESFNLQGNFKQITKFEPINKYQKSICKV